MDMFQLAGLDDLLRVRTIIIWNIVHELEVKVTKSLLPAGFCLFLQIKHKIRTKSEMSSLPTLASSPLNLVAIRDQEKNRMKELLSQVLDGESFHCRSREKSA